jgi:hypothetical protein
MLISSDKLLTLQAPHTNTASSKMQCSPVSKSSDPAYLHHSILGTCGRKNNGPAMEAIKLLGIRVHNTRPPTNCIGFVLAFPLEDDFLVGERLLPSTELFTLDASSSFTIYITKHHKNINSNSKTTTCIAARNVYLQSTVAVAFRQVVEVAR